LWPVEMGHSGIEGRVLRIQSGARRDSIIELIRASPTDPDSRPLDVLIDARALEDAPEQLSTDLIRERARELATRFRRCAVVPANVPLQRALATYFAMSAKAAGMETRIFLTVEEAEDWLGITPEVPARPRSSDP